MNEGKEILYLAVNDIEELQIPMSMIIDIVEKALKARGEGEVEMPPKPGIHPVKDAFIHAMPCYLPSFEAAGIKWVSGFPENQKLQLPYISGLLILNSPTTGMPLSVMDCTWLTAKRTAAASAVSAKYLAKKDASSLAIIGCGVQGRSHLEALSLVLPLQEIRVYDINREVQDRYVEDLGQDVSFSIKGVSSPREAIEGADVIVTTGPIQKNPTPILKKEWLKEGVLGVPIDFDAYWKPEALHACHKFFVDDTPQFLYYQKTSYFKDAPPIYGDLGELLVGKKVGREADSEMIISMNLGLALEDMAVASRIYSIAKEKGLGRILPL